MFVHKHNWAPPRPEAPWIPAFNRPESVNHPRALKDIQHYFDTANNITLVQNYNLPNELRVPEGEEVYRDAPRLAKAVETLWRDHQLPGKIDANTKIQLCITCGGHQEEHHRRYDPIMLDYTFTMGSAEHAHFAHLR